MFLREQGYPINSSIVYQDNQSAMKMITNGRMSCTGNSKHVDIRYFFVKDRIDKKEIRIEYCPTDEMLADYFTKPLQGALFTKLRRVIMGWDHISLLNKKKKGSTSAPEERVGIVPNGTSCTAGTEGKNGIKNTIKKDVSWADRVKGAAVLPTPKCGYTNANDAIAKEGAKLILLN